MDGGETRLAARAYRQILDLILSGETKPGEHLNERGLADRLRMSRTPVRDALLMLEAEGLIVRQGRMGVQIKQMRIEELLDALQIRQLLEPTLARMAAGRIWQSDLEEIEAALHAVLKTAGPDGSGVNREQTRWIDERLHGLIADSASNPQLSDIVRSLRRKTQIFDLKNLPERTTDTCHEHLEIIAGLREKDGARTEAAMTRHLEQVRASIIARLTRT